MMVGELRGTAGKRRYGLEHHHKKQDQLGGSRGLMTRKLLPVALPILFLAALGIGNVLGQSEVNETILVGLKHCPPMVICQKDSDTEETEAWGYEVNVLQSIRPSFTQFEYECIDNILEESSHGIKAGCLSVTEERLADFRFSQDFFSTSLAILINEPPGTELYGIELLITPFEPLLWGMLAVCASLLLTFLIITRRRRILDAANKKYEDPDMGKKSWLPLPKEEVDPPTQLMRWGRSILTFAQYTLETGMGSLPSMEMFKVGRMGYIYLLTSLMLAFVADSLYGSMVTSLVVLNSAQPSIQDLSSLEDKRIATSQEHYTPFDYLASHPTLKFEKLVSCDNATQAAQMLGRGEVDAVVWDEVQLRFAAQTHFTCSVKMLYETFYLQSYAFMYNETVLSGNLRGAMNSEILELMDHDVMRARSSWFVTGEVGIDLSCTPYIVYTRLSDGPEPFGIAVVYPGLLIPAITLVFFVSCRLFIALKRAFTPTYEEDDDELDQEEA